MQFVQDIGLHVHTVPTRIPAQILNYGIQCGQKIFIDGHQAPICQDLILHGFVKGLKGYHQGIYHYLI